MANIDKVLEILMLSEVKEVNLEIIKHQYSVLSKIYHPDTTKIPEYQNGKKFIELSEAFEYASVNVSLVNQFLINQRSRELRFSEFYEYFDSIKSKKEQSSFYDTAGKGNVSNSQYKSYNKHTKIFIAPLIISILMLIAVFPLPYGYYTLLRITTFVIGMIIIYYQYKINNGFTNELIWTSIAIIIWNPIFPIYFERELWIFLDLIGFLYFVYLALKVKNY